MPAYPVVGSLPVYRWPTGTYTGVHYDQALFDIRRRYGPIVREWRGWRRKPAEKRASVSGNEHIPSRIHAT